MFFYHQQFKKHLVQFMAIFEGTEVKTGVSHDGAIKTIKVPIMYASLDRVAASIMANNTQNLPTRLPIMSAYLSNIALANDRFKGIDTKNDAPYTPRGGVIGKDTKTISQIMAIPYKLTIDLNIYSSNLDQQLQILEQTLILFNPSLQIQKSDNLFDSGKITSVELTGIQNNENFPIGSDRRTIQHTLTFDMIVYLTAPSAIKDDRVKRIQIRLNEINDADLEQLNRDDNEITISI